MRLDLNAKTVGCRGALWASLFFVSLFVVMAFRYLNGHHVMMTTDAIISGGNKIGIEVFRLLGPYWGDQSLLGSPSGGSAQIPVFIKIFLPAIFWNNWSYLLACLLTGIAVYFYLKEFVKVFWVRIFAGLVAAWLGSNLTLLYAGHGSKPYVVLFFVCALLPVARMVAGSIYAALIYGACVGLMFVQQPDMAMFFVLFLGAYVLFRLWKEQGLKPLGWAKVLVPAMVIAFLFAAGPLLSGYKLNVEKTAQVQTQGPQEKWDYVTQWSFPPEEMIAFVAPGYTGWRSGEPDGPYWGRMGQSAGWEKTRQGFQNFKLENTYLGIIPVAFALFALFSCRRSKHRAEIFFWSGAALIALLLAFGKFFPLYSLFYKLPIVNNIRNPNKFLQVFQVCLAILTAYGFDALFSRTSNVEGQRSEVRGRKTNAKNQIAEDLFSALRPLTSEPRRFFWFTTGILGLLTLWVLSLMLNRTEGVAEFVALGWPQDAARVMVQNKITALWHASFMVGVLAAVFSLFSFPRFGKLLRYKNGIAAALVLIVAADAVKLSKHYIKEMPRSYIEANALTDFLQENVGEERVALLTQQGIYNIWLTYLLPYNNITTFNFAQMPRMPADYKNFLAATSKNPLHMWRFSGVKYLLGSTSFEKQLPPSQARKIFAYDLAPAPNGGFRVVASLQGAHAVFELLGTLPRYSMVAPIAPMDDSLALQTIASSLRRPTGSVEVISSRPGRVELQVHSDQAGTLRSATRWDADWKATVDGKSIAVDRIDYICQGVSIPAGSHVVSLVYSPSKLFFYFQCGGCFVLLAALMVTQGICFGANQRRSRDAG